MGRWDYRIIGIDANESVDLLENFCDCFDMSEIECVTKEVSATDGYKVKREYGYIGR